MPEAVESDAAFVVSAEQRGTRHRLEAVVASGEAGRWYHRVHLEADEVTHDYTAACTCGVEECVHIRAALGVSEKHLPGIVPGRRRTSEGPQLQIGTSTDDGDWFDLNVSVTVAGEQVDFRELFAALVRGESVYLLPDGWYFPLNTPELETLRRVIEEARTLNDAPSPDFGSAATRSTCGKSWPDWIWWPPTSISGGSRSRRSPVSPNGWRCRRASPPICATTSGAATNG